MRLFALLAALTVLFIPQLRAEDAPPPVPAPVGQQAVTPPVPAPAAPQTPAPVANAPAARKEEEEVKIRSKLFAGFFGGGNTITPAQAADEITRLRAENDDLKKQLADSRNELAAIAEDWPAIREALLAGKADAPVLQTPLGQQVTQAAAAAAANAAGQPAHPAAQLPGPGADKPATSKPSGPVAMPTLAEAGREYWADKGAPWLTSANT